MPRLSDSTIQSVKLRASGTDNYVEPSPFSTKLPFERHRLQPVMSQLQPSSMIKSSLASGESHPRASLDRHPPLPSLSALSVAAARCGDGDSTPPSSMTRLRKRSRYQHDIAAAHGREEPRQDGVSNSHDAVSSPHLPAVTNSEIRRVSPTNNKAASPTSRASSTRENRSLLPLSQSSSSATTAAPEEVEATTSNATTATSMQLLGARVASTADSAASDTSAAAKPKKKRVRIKTERRREQCRANQARYRNKQRAIRLAFHETLGYLRDEVKELEAKRRALAYGLHMKKSPWNVVVDYFRLFRRGACVRTNEYFGGSSPTENSVTALYLETEHGEEQLAFLRSVMAPDVNLVGCEANGVDALAEQWVSWSRSCNAFELHLERIEKAPGQRDTLAATTVVCVTITDSTVRTVFPHLLARQDRNGSEHEGRSSDSELAWKLCGRRLEFKCVMWFECNPRTSQVLRLRSQFDIVPPLMSALGSLRDVARVLDGARLTSDGFFIRGRWQQSDTAYGGSRRLGSASYSLSVAGRGTGRRDGKDERVDDQDESADSEEGDSDDHE